MASEKIPTTTDRAPATSESNKKEKRWEVWGARYAMKFSNT